MEGSVLQQELELKDSELDTTFDVLSPKTKQNKTNNGMYCFCNTLFSLNFSSIKFRDFRDLGKIVKFNTREI